MKKIFLLVMMCFPSTSFGAFSEWVTTDLNTTKTSILKAWSRVCSFAPGGCNGWAGKKVGIYVYGPDGTGIYYSTSTSSVDMTAWTTPGGCWSYNGGSWCASSAGSGSHYYGRLCGRGWTPNAIIAAKFVDDGGSYTYAAQCNFSPYVSFPSDWNSTWFDSNVCGSQYSGTAWISRHEIVFSGSDNRHFAGLVCQQNVNFGTFSEFGAIEITNPWPVSSFDNQSIVQELSAGLNALKASSDPILTAYASSVESDVTGAISALTKGIGTTGALNTGTYFDNPFSSIDTSGNYVSAVSSVYVVGMSSVVVNVNVVSSATFTSPQLDSILDYLTGDSTAPVDVSGSGEYASYTSSSTALWETMAVSIDSMTATIGGLFDFDGLTMWDGCITLKTSALSLNGQNAGMEDTIFCMGSVGGWNDIVLPLIRFVVLVSTFMSCLWWFLE